MTIRPSFIYVNFSDVKWQRRLNQINAHSSESKGSGDELGTFLYTNIWHYYARSEKPWHAHKVKISPAMQTSGYKTIITNDRFRVFIMGGTNSNQNYEYVPRRTTLKECKFMNTCRAYFADAQRSDRYIYAIGGRGNQSLVEFEEFKKSQRNMERYDIDKDRWLELNTQLNEGRYHATACILHDRYIYVFGGYKTKNFKKQMIMKVRRNFETIDNVSSNYIEMYDTNND